MEEFNELEKINAYHVEILRFKKKGDVVLTICCDNNKIILSGKAASNLINLVDDYLNKIYKKHKGSKLVDDYLNKIYQKNKGSK